jgi:hypothetical protein
MRGSAAADPMDRFRPRALTDRVTKKMTIGTTAMVAEPDVSA